MPVQRHSLDEKTLMPQMATVHSDSLTMHRVSLVSGVTATSEEQGFPLDQLPTRTSDPLLETRPETSPFYALGTVLPDPNDDFGPPQGTYGFEEDDVQMEDILSPNLSYDAQDAPSFAHCDGSNATKSMPDTESADELVSTTCAGAYMYQIR